MEPIDISGRMPGGSEGARLWALPLGPYQTNCYVYTPDGEVCWIIDPGMGPDAVIEHVRSAGLSVNASVLTHAHSDHIMGID